MRATFCCANILLFLLWGFRSAERCAGAIIRTYAHFLSIFLFPIRIYRYDSETNVLPPLLHSCDIYIVCVAYLSIFFSVHSDCSPLDAFTEFFSHITKIEAEKQR